MDTACRQRMKSGGAGNTTAKDYTLLSSLPFSEHTALNDGFFPSAKSCSLSWQAMEKNSIKIELTEQDVILTNHE